MKVAVVGVTGLVGSKMVEILQERNFPVTEFYPVASEKSLGKEINFKGETYNVISAEQALSSRPDIAIFSAGAEASRRLAPLFAEQGCRVIDNSSFWRMDATKKLIIPEINASILTKDDYIIANPNCSTIQMLMALAPLHKAFRLKRIVVSTYQSVTGSGYKAIAQLDSERASQVWGEYPAFYPYPIDNNIIPHIDSFLENAYTKEEQKMVDETHKILEDYSIAVSPTAARVPVKGGHSESINAEFYNDFSLDDIRDIWKKTDGLLVQDDTSTNFYPMPLEAWNHDEVYVGRLRRDLYQPNTINFWCVADNIRKGAATNAIQIAETLLEKEIIKIY